MLTKERFKKLLIEGIAEKDSDKIDQLYDELYILQDKSQQHDNKILEHEFTLRELVIEMKRGFERMDKRFEDLIYNMDKRFEQVDKRFEQVDKRFEDMNKKFNLFMWLIGAGLALTNILIAFMKFAN